MLRSLSIPGLTVPGSSGFLEPRRGDQCAQPNADLRVALTTAREARIAQRWDCEAIGSFVAFFCTREGVRHRVSIESRPPPRLGSDGESLKIWPRAAGSSVARK